MQRLLGRHASDTVAGALAEAEALVAAGNYRAAIDLLTIRDRRAADPAIEQRLALLRHAAFRVEPTSPPASRWPPALPDPFPGTRGIPAIAAAELSSPVLGGAIAHHGALIVRGLVSAAHAARMVEDIDRALQAYDDTVAGRGTPDQARWFTAYGPGVDADYSETIRRWGRESGGQLLLADSPRALFDMIEIWTAIGLGPVLAGYFGEWPALSFKKSTLRRTSPTSATEWHQDGAFLGGDTRTVNVWLACSPCGVDAPSIDLVGRRLDDLVETGTGSAAFSWSVAREVGDQVGGSDIVRPVFAAGDAVLFDQLNLHRTGVGPGMTRTRYAVENWFFAPSTYPHDQVPILF